MSDSFTERPEQGARDFGLPVHQGPVTAKVNGVSVDIEYQDQDNVVLSNPVNASDLVEIFYTGRGSLEQPGSVGGGIPGGGVQNQVLKRVIGPNPVAEWGWVSYNDLTDKPTIPDYAESFETVSKNLKARDAVFSYTGGVLTAIAYAGNITKTFGYTGGRLSSVTLSGSGLPAGTTLTKSFTYNGSGNLIGITYN